MTIHDTSQFRTAGLVQWVSNYPTSSKSLTPRRDATMSAMNLWHNPAIITDSSYTTSFASFLLNTNFPAITVAGVINNFPTGRQQVRNVSITEDKC